MGLRLSTKTRNDLLGGAGEFETAWDTDGRINIYAGTQPTTSEMNGALPPAGSTLLGTLTLSADAFGAIADGVITAAAITSDTNADATGTAAWFLLFKNGDGLTADADPWTKARISGTCGTSGADLNFDSTSIVAGGTIAISSFSITMPAS